jgi:mono/diheme cytochrome c family protein
MKKTGMWALLLGLMISSGVSAAGNADAGKEVYAKHCVACHGADGNGNEKLAKVLNVTIPPLPSKEVQAVSDDDLKKGIIEGKGKMKPVKELSSTDVTNVIAFIRSLAKK